MTPQDFDQSIEKALGDSRAHLDDDGFTERVMQRLPKNPTQANNPWLAGLWLAGGLASLFPLLLSPGRRFLSATFESAVHSPASSLPMVLAAAVMLAALAHSVFVTAISDT